MDEQGEIEFSFRTVIDPNNQEIRQCSHSVNAYVDGNNVVWYSNVYAIPLISAMGIIGNVVNATVLWKTGKRLPSHTYLLSLAVCDCLFLTFATLEVTPVMFDSFVSNPTCNKIYTHSVLYLRFISSTFFKVSVMLVVGFNVERYICVCRPMRSSWICNRRTARRAICAFVCVSLIMSLHWPLIHETDKCYDTVRNGTFYMIRLPQSQTLIMYNQVMNYVSAIFFNIVPIFALFFLNVVLLRTLRNVIRRESLNSTSTTPDVRRRTRTANAILFAVVFMFLICNGPQVPARILFEHYGPYDDIVNVYVSVSQTLIFMNASLNFALYCLVSKRYRDSLLETFPCFARTYKAAASVQRWLLRRRDDLTMKVGGTCEYSRTPVVVAAVLEMNLDDESRGYDPILKCELESS